MFFRGVLGVFFRGKIRGKKWGNFECHKWLTFGVSCGIIFMMEKSVQERTQRRIKMSTVRDILDYISDVKYYSHFYVPVECFESQEGLVANVSPAVLMDFLKNQSKFGIEQCVAFINEQRTVWVEDFVQGVLRDQKRKFSQQDCERFRINTINAMGGQDLGSVVYGCRIVVRFFRGYPSYIPVMTLNTILYADDWFLGNGDIKEKVLRGYLLKQQ